MWEKKLKIHLGKYYGRLHGVLPSKHSHKHLHTRTEWGAFGPAPGLWLANPAPGLWLANKAVCVAVLRQVEWLLSRCLTRWRVGVHGPGEAHWGANGPWRPLYFSVCRAQEKHVEAGGAQGRRPMVVICPQTSKALPVPLKVLCHLGKGHSLPSVTRQHVRLIQLLRKISLNQTPLIRN